MASAVRMSWNSISIRAFRSWLITGRVIATKIKNASPLCISQINELSAEARRECPNCKHVIDNSDVALEWPGFPDGVKFDPSDLQLIEHLEAKLGLGNSNSHIFIDEFIPTLEKDEGICYTHPENLPGIKKDGSSTHFFHRISNAYACGQRKRRKISHGDGTISEENVRWHKTGKSRPVWDDGIKKGWKKIMVLYKGSKKGCRPDKTNWVMHQYHLGVQEDEMDGELVVSKIFYQMQAKQMDTSELDTLDEKSDAFAVRIGPRTPRTNTPQPRRPNNSPCETEQNAPFLQHEMEEPGVPIVHLKDEAENPAWLAGEPRAVEQALQTNLDESLQCREDFDSFSLGISQPFDYSNLYQGASETVDKNLNAAYAFPDLDNVDLGTPPDLQLADLQFGSQESIGSWLERL